MKIKTLITLVCVSIIFGCSDPKIDTSTDESMKSSISKVRESLPEGKRQEFDEAIQILAFSKIDMKDLFTAGATGVGNIEGKMRDSLNGKSGAQIIELVPIFRTVH